MRLQMTRMLVRVSGLAVGMPGYSAEPNEQAAAIAEVKRLGGRVTVDEKRPEKPVVSVILAGTQVTDEGVKKLQQALQKCKIMRSGSRRPNSAR